MTAKKLIEDMIQGYVENTGMDLDDDSVKPLLPYISDGALSRKMAAKLIHIFMRDIMKLSDLDWDRALKLKDIYECRTCANSIAQVFQRGIILPLEEDRFGSSEDFTPEVEKQALNSLLNCKE
jgi:hypothetical protein